MKIDVITKDSALYKTRCGLCRKALALGQSVLYAPTGALGGWCSWHTSCVEQLIHPGPAPLPQAEIDAFVARETARIQARSA